MLKNTQKCHYSTCALDDKQLIVVFNRSSSAQTTPETPWIRRTIGLPGERVQIKNGKVYINQQLYLEDYIVSGPTMDRDRSFSIPANSYLVINDNRQPPDENIVTKSAIVGKVVWHF